MEKILFFGIPIPITSHKERGVSNACNWQDTHDEAQASDDGRKLCAIWHVMNHRGKLNGKYNLNSDLFEHHVFHNA